MLMSRLFTATAFKSKGVFLAAERIRPITARFQVRGMALADKKCLPCEGGDVPVLEPAKAEEMLKELQEGWKVTLEADVHRLRREWKTKNFLAALEICGRIAEVAEAEGHHPDLHVTGWNNLAVEVFTHSVSGLTENDFILASKIDKVDTTGLLRVKKKKPNFADV